MTPGEESAMFDVGTNLLSGMVTDLAREGLRVYLRKQAGDSAGHAVNLATPGTATSRVELSFAAPLGARPYWVLVGLQPWQGERLEAAALFPEPLVLVVPRGEYDIVTLFLSRPRSFIDKPVLNAFGRTHDVLVGRRHQLTLRGWLPNPELSGWLDRNIPVESRGFRLPSLESPSASKGVALSTRNRVRPRRALPESGSVTDPARRRLRAGTPAAPSSTAASPTAAGEPYSPEFKRLLEDMKADGRLSRRPVRRGSTSDPPPQRAPVVARDGICLARTRKGKQCRRPADPGRGALCAKHFEMVKNGQTVLWHRSGTAIRPRRRS